MEDETEAGERGGNREESWRRASALHCRYVDTREKQVERLKGTGGRRMFERIKRVLRLPRTRVLSIHGSPFFFSLHFFPPSVLFPFLSRFSPFSRRNTAVRRETESH